MKNFPFGRHLKHRPRRRPKVTFFKQYPHHFLRPYDAQLECMYEEFLQKLTPRNCEWLMRPKIALSEVAQALRENWELFNNCEWINAGTRESIHNIMTSIVESFVNVDTKEKSTQATESDICNIMR